MNARIAQTLIEANQYSNSPYERAESRFTAVSTIMRPKPICQCGKSIQAAMICAPAIASTATTTTQKYQ